MQPPLAPVTDMVNGQLRIVVAIPTLNEEGTIADVLWALASERACFPDLNIVVADGGSRDQTVAIVQDIAKKWPFVHLIHNEKVLQSAGVNEVARHFSHTDILVRCDAHAVYPARYIEQLAAALERVDADSVVVPMDSSGHTAFEKVVAWVSDTPVGSGGSGHRGGQRSGFVDHGHHAAFRTEAFLSVGGYDESFRHNEDAEFDCRFSAHGHRVFLDATIRIGYRPRSGFRSLWRQYFNYGRGRSRTVRRHPSSLRMRQFAVPFHFAASVLSIGSAVLFQNAGFLTWPAVYLAVLSFVSFYFALRKRDCAGLLAGPVAFTMHSAWALGFFWGLVSLRESRWKSPHQTSRPAERAAGAIKALLVDPSRFTVPYDAQLSAGLAQAEVVPIWATRPLRKGEHEEFPPQQRFEIFYRRFDKAEFLPRVLRKPAKAVAHLAGLIRVILLSGQSGADVIHFQWMLLPLFDAIAIFFLRIRRPVFVTVHDSVPFNGDRLTAPQSFAIDLPLRLATGVIVHTIRARDLLVRRGINAGKIAVVPHGPLPLTGVVPVPAPERGTDGRWTFLLFGQIKPYKGLDILIEALGTIPPGLRQKARVIVAGVPRMELSGILGRAEELKLSGMLDLRLAYQTNEELNALLVQSDCFVFPYRQIDASGAYYLAQSLGKWVIASRVGVFEDEVLEGANGRLVTPEDPAELSGALVEAIQNKPEIAVSSRPKGWPAIGQATAAFYRSFLPQNEASRSETLTAAALASRND
jgi:succinoglycan biosynthesis protein ExoA